MILLILDILLALAGALGLAGIMSMALGLTGRSREHKRQAALDYLMAVDCTLPFALPVTEISTRVIMRHVQWHYQDRKKLARMQRRGKS
jgi:membrane-bound ClpP family serine protease